MYIIVHDNRMLTNKTDNRIKILLEDGRSIYHTQDLAVLWRISNENTLYKTISRYIKKGLLKSIHKGFYSTLPIEKLDPFYLGVMALKRYGYVSTESILKENGVIFQDIKYITLVSDISKRMKIKYYSFLVRKMKEDYLYNPAGILFSGSIAKASLERAVADMLYFNPHYYFDNEKSIDWKKVKEIKNTIGY